MVTELTSCTLLLVPRCEAYRIGKSKIMTESWRRVEFIFILFTDSMLPFFFYFLTENLGGEEPRAHKSRRTKDRAPRCVLSLQCNNFLFYFILFFPKTLFRPVLFAMSTISLRIVLSNSQPHSRLVAGTATPSALGSSQTRQPTTALSEAWTAALAAACDC